jgi:antirestriction protein ArdC
MTKEYVKADHSHLLAELTDGISALTSSAEWTKYLEVQARFHRYSANNCMLIALQSGGYATQVAGFNTWKAQGRNVKKGEKGMYILAPLAFKSTDKVTGEETYGVKGFRYVAVFDLAQTEGPDLPEIANKLTGAGPLGAYETLAGVAGGLGFSVIDHDFEGSGVNGDCSHANKVLRVEVTNSPAQRVKTLAHEISHAILHDPETGAKVERAIKELEAESSAYVICKALGLDTDAYSFGYVAGWSGGGDAAVKAIRASTERIHKASDQVLKTYESFKLEAVAA